MWHLRGQVTTVARVQNAGRRLLAAAAGLVLLAAVRQLIIEEPGLAGVVIAALMVGAAAFLFTFVIRPESAFFLRDANPEVAGPDAQPEIIDLTHQPESVEPVAPGESIESVRQLRPQPRRANEPTRGLTQDSDDSTITPEAM